MVKHSSAIEVKKDDLSIKNRLDYNEIAEMLKEGKSVFVANLSVKSASYARKRLRQILNADVQISPAEMKQSHQEGYSFEMRRPKEVKDTWL